MRFAADHDLHIHSGLSLCSGDPEQNPSGIFRYGLENGFHTLCLTDHMWDPAVPGASDFGFYESQPYERTRSVLPLPQSDTLRFLFGCETDMDRGCVIGVSPAVAAELDFIIVPTTHLHMNGFTLEGGEGADERAKLWISRFDALLDAPLPFEKVGVAHLTCSLIFGRRTPEVLEKIPLDEYHRLFAKARERGIGVELNFPAPGTDAPDARIMLLPYRIAKEEGCKFYLGSDAHHPEELRRAKANFEAITDLLGLTEDDKIPLLL
ncbi:MAG: hypothetical protein IJS78_03210 [Clostridia bacterium]|nr:hypothetical protein [Clostridia bacterium]